jgi:hypothetical protein
MEEKKKINAALEHKDGDYSKQRIEREKENLQ